MFYSEDHGVLLPVYQYTAGVYVVVINGVCDLLHCTRSKIYYRHLYIPVYIYILFAHPGRTSHTMHRVNYRVKSVFSLCT